MESFKPQKDEGPFHFLTHPAVQIAGIFLVIFLAVVFIRAHNSSSSVTSATTKGIGNEPREAAATSATTTAAPVAASQPPPPAAFPPPPPPPPANNANVSNVAPPTAAADSTVAASSGAPADAVKTLKLKVVLAEVDDLTLKKWATDANFAGVGGTDWRGGVLPSISQRLSEDRSIVNMESSQKPIDPSHLNQDLFFGKTLESGEVGFHINIAVGDITGPTLPAHVTIVRQIDSGDPKNVEFDMELPPKGGWVLSHLLTSHPDFNKEAMDDPKSFFQIFKSERFKSKRSDFTILILFDTDSGT